MPAVGKAPSPGTVKSPDARSPSRAKSPAATRSKGTRRSWGFAMAARLAASLRQSLEGEPAAPKQEPQSPVVECQPATIAEHAPVYDTAGSRSDAGHEAPDAPPGSHDDAAHAEEDPFSPIFSPLSSGLDRMQAGPGYEDGGSGDDSSWRQSHADDLDLLQKQAGLPTASPSASAPGDLDAAAAAAAAQDAEDSRPAGELAEHVSTPLHHPGAFQETPCGGLSDDAAGAGALASGPLSGQTPDTSSRTATTSQTAAQGVEAAAGTSSGNRWQAMSKDAATSTDDAAATTSPQTRTFFTSRSSSKKVQSMASTADAQEVDDPPESPSPLREGLAFMTPLSAFDGIPEPRSGTPARYSHSASPASDAVASEAGMPRMLSLDACQDHLTEGLQASDAAAGAAGMGNKAELNQHQPSTPAMKQPLPTIPAGQQQAQMNLIAGVSPHLTLLVSN